MEGWAEAVVIILSQCMCVKSTRCTSYTVLCQSYLSKAKEECRSPVKKLNPSSRQFGTPFLEAEEWGRLRPARVAEQTADGSPGGRVLFPPSVFPAHRIDLPAPNRQSRITRVGVGGESDRTGRLFTLLVGGYHNASNITCDFLKYNFQDFRGSISRINAKWI